MISCNFSNFLGLRWPDHSVTLLSDFWAVFILSAIMVDFPSLPHQHLKIYFWIIDNLSRMKWTSLWLNLNFPNWLVIPTPFVCLPLILDMLKIPIPCPFINCVACFVAMFCALYRSWLLLIFFLLYNLQKMFPIQSVASSFYWVLILQCKSILFHVIPFSIPALIAYASGVFVKKSLPVPRNWSFSNIFPGNLRLPDHKLRFFTYFGWFWNTVYYKRGILLHAS